MENQTYVSLSFLRLSVVFYALFISFVNGDGICRRASGGDVNTTLCVRNVACQHYHDRLVVSWGPPQDRKLTLDFVIQVSNVIINRTNESVLNNRSEIATVTASYTSPPITFTSSYSATINRRTSFDDLGLIFAIQKECTKVYTSSPDPLSKTEFPKGIVTTLGGKVQGDESTTSDFRYVLGLDESFVIVIVLSVAVVFATVVVIVLAWRCYKKKRTGNCKDKGTKEKPTSPTTTDQSCEGDTYNHLTLRYQEKKITQERISQDTYAHITEGEDETPDQLQMNSNNSQPQLSRRYDANYDDIPYEYDDSNKTKQATVNMGAFISNNINENGSTSDVLQGPITGDVSATVDKSNTKSNGDTLSRVEGPQGDLYTEVAIKR